MNGHEFKEKYNYIGEDVKDTKQTISYNKLSKYDKYFITVKRNYKP